MAPVAPALTQRLVEQGDRVENQLTTRLSAGYPALQFRRQGSVSNFTHIRYYSDVDILTIIDKFYTLEPPQQPAIPYQGEPIDDLIELRKHCVRELEAAFPSASVNDDGSTSIVLEGGSLACSVDIVPSNWYDTNAYAAGEGEHTRGIMVLNKEERTRMRNYPFLFNHRLDVHDRARTGVPRMLIRLLKSEKADHEEESGTELEASSFDICSIVYRMPDSYLDVPLRQPLRIILALLKWLYHVLSTTDLQKSLKVIDDSRLIFDSSEKASALGKIYADLYEDYSEALKEQAGHVLITEAHIGSNQSEGPKYERAI
jgi:hypothetical protein